MFELTVVRSKSEILVASLCEKNAVYLAVLSVLCVVEAS